MMKYSMVGAYALVDDHKVKIIEGIDRIIFEADKRNLYS